MVSAAIWRMAMFRVSS